jgi:acyl dehydratase
VPVSLHLDEVGVDDEPARRTWDATQALLYALGVGAGLGDPTRELAFTTERGVGGDQQVVPTFGVVLTSVPRRQPWRDLDPATVVHGELSVEWFRPLPTEGTAEVRSRVAAIEDKGTGALVTREATLCDPGGGRPWLATRSGVFCRGAGGFGGGRRQRTPAWRVPGRPPDEVVVRATRPEQALLYRLSGDRNPLHADPAVARRAGFDRPLLHGLCTFGITCRALLAACCAGDPARLRSMAGRFSAPVLPGDELSVEVWRDGGRAWFRTRTGDGAVAVDRGEATFH